MAKRILKGAPATLSVILLDQNGEPRSAGGDLTVEVTRADGTTLKAAGTAATTGSNAGQYTVTLSATETDTLDLLTAVWTDSAGGTATTTYEVVGGFYFSIPEARLSDDTLTADEYSSDYIAAVRQEVEEECELITGRSFVPRYRYVEISGIGQAELTLPIASDVRAIRSVSVDGVAFNESSLADLFVTGAGVLSRKTLGNFARGTANVVIGLEYGWDAPPADLKRAALTRLRSRLNMDRSAIPDRATTFSNPDGTFGLAAPGRNGWETGIFDVDVVYNRYATNTPVFA